MPIPFSLRLPKDTSLEGRNLVVTARMVVGRNTLFELNAPHVMATADLDKPIDLLLDKAGTGRR